MNEVVKHRKLTRTEIRWRDGTTATRYMKDGETIRCQAVSKTKLRAARVARGYDPYDTTITSDDVWPEAQCSHPAVPGKLVCGGKTGHGGNSMDVPYHHLMDVMPVDLKEKMELLMENPEVLSRRLEIIELSARNLQLMEEMKNDKIAGSDNDEQLRDALNELVAGNFKAAEKTLRDVIESKAGQQKRWREVRENIVILKDLSRTEMSTIKEFRQMITSDQFMNVLLSLADAVTEAAEKYISDKTIQSNVIGHVYASVRRFINARPGVLQPAALGDGGDNGAGEA